jgi:hypothetical protein
MWSFRSRPSMSASIIDRPWPLFAHEGITRMASCYLEKLTGRPAQRF